MVNLFFANAADKKVTARKGELLEQCRSLLSLAGDTVFEFDRNRRVLFASQQDIVLNSFSDGDVVGKRAAELFPSDISRQLASALDHAEESGNRTTFEFEVNDFRNERWFSADVIAAVLVGEFRYILIVREVSGQRLREKQLLKEGRRLQALYDDLPILISEFLPDTTLTYVNKANANYIGLTPEKLVGKKFTDFLSQDERERLEAAFSNITAENPVSFTIQEVVIGGQRRYQKWENHGYFNSQGNLVLCRAIGVDITEITLRERELKESRQRFEQLSEQSRTFSWEIDPMGIYTYVSPAVETILGFYPDELVGRKTFYDLVPENSREEVRNAWVSSKGDYASLTAYENCILAKDGSEVWVLTSCFPLYDAHGEVKGFNGSDTDITAIKRAEKEQQETSERLTQISDNIEEVFWLRSNDPPAMLYINKAYEKVWGRSCQSLYDNPDSFLDSVYAEDRERVLAEFRRTQKTGKFSMEYRIVRPDGDIRWIHARTFPIMDGKGDCSRWGGMALDITERKHAEEEKEKIEGQLAQAQKMEVLGQLAGGIAHDFNNMLGVIQGHAEMAMEEAGNSGPLQEHISAIQTAAGRSADLTRQLLTFSRKQVVSPVVCRVNETVEGMFDMLSRLIGADVQLTWLPETSLWPVKIDPAQLHQILANLCVNAVDAISESAVEAAKIVIETKNKVFDESCCPEQAASIGPGEYVMLTISDNGCGMNPDTVDHIFEPFFTTKEIGKGTGLGLSTVYGIIEQNEGVIHVYSEQGVGTTFNIYFKRYLEGEKTVTCPQKPSAVPQGSGQKIMLVEDEKPILEMVSRVLEKLGYSVVSTPSPGEAIGLMKDHGEEIDLLVTDVVMPEMNGNILSARLRAYNPQLKILFMSGYTNTAIDHQKLLKKQKHFIQKPFSIKELGNAVHLALTES